MVIAGLSVQKAGGVDTQTPPTYSQDFFKLTCPNAAGFLPLRQDALTLLEGKLTSEHWKTMLTKHVEAFNKDWNPSGIPFKGEAKRVEPETPTAEEFQSKKPGTVYETAYKGSEGSRFKETCEVIESFDSGHQLLLKDSKLYVYAVQDTIVKDDKALGRLYCQFLSGDQKKQEIAKHKAASYMWEMTSTTSESFVFYVQKGTGAQAVAHNDGKPDTMENFLRHLEDSEYLNVSVACHSLNEVEDKTPGAPTRWTIKSDEECLMLATDFEGRRACFLVAKASVQDTRPCNVSIEDVHGPRWLGPAWNQSQAKPLPKNVKPSVACIASCMDATQWDWKVRCKSPRS
jgi:hypothetical protein